MTIHPAPGALIRAAWRPRGFGYPSGLGDHHAYVGHAYGGGSWIGHMVVSSIVHGLIYGAIFRVLARLSLGQVVLLAVVVVGGLYLWNRNRGAGRW